MNPLGERRRGERERAARFDAQLTAFGEILATHPFTTDRPGSTHVMAVEYARALDAYEAASREADRDMALARRELDEGVAALNRLNAHLAGTPLPPARVPEPEPPAPEREVLPPAPVSRPAPAERGAKPRLRDRYTPEQLALRTGLVVLALYTIAVIATGTWIMAVCSIIVLNVGLGMACGGGILGWEALTEIWGAAHGGLVRAEYSHTAKRPHPGVNDAPFDQHYIHRTPEGRTVTYRRGVPKASLEALPTRRLWLLKGDEPKLRAFSSPPLLALSLIFTVPLSLAGAAISLAAVPGVLIAALTGHLWG